MRRKTFQQRAGCTRWVWVKRTGWGSFPMPGDAVSAHRRWQDGMKSDHPGQRARVLRGRQHLTMTEGIPGFVAQEQRKAEQVCLPIHSARLRPTAPQYEEVLRFDARMSRSAV